ncbi:MAG: bifunctional folylpolyglutamate synthase/dihydrofolate synthase [Proteobacteria bacterium]|nr:bifunctional folylpolyglutamate synthase/dihydrofolate synthase [Pseudomonadota bacterium]
MSLGRLDQSHIDLGLVRMIQLMERLGNPHLDFKAIHIAGTNGKGSTAAMIDSILRAEGYRSGLYTSPHLERFSERIKINAEEIADDVLERLSSDVKEAADKSPMIEATYFEFTTAVAFLYFARAGLDMAVIETGLGGRLDATNILKPLVSVITPVAIDHCEYLGDTLEAVAAEKAGIIKPSVPVVFGKQPDEVLAVLEADASGKKSETLRFDCDYRRNSLPEGKFQYKGISIELDGLGLSLVGSHQQDNAAVAIAATECLSGSGLAVAEPAIRQGLMSVFWPGRYEVISKSPDIILDGAHNPAGVGVLTETMEIRYPRKKGVVIAGFMADKDIDGMLERLAPIANVIILTNPGGERGFDPQGKIGYKDTLNKETELIVLPDVEAALSRGRSLIGEAPFMLVTGSLFLIGGVRKRLIGEL